MVGFKANQITSVPAEALAPTLNWLILTDNRIQKMPSSIGQCLQMQKLMLAGNQLSGLPVELKECKNLELLRLSANRFSALPTWLFNMPKLAWLALAGNPMTDSFEATRKAPSIDNINWKNIDVGAKLGEGASGVIYQAKQQSNGFSKDVAVKLFKSAVTSDGLPRSEMAASIAVGLHPNFVGVLGQISHHPDNAQSLVMPLVTTDYINLAQPPSLDSCTRDIYANSTVVGLIQLCKIASGVAQAAEYLHNQGILHGDLYAHNVLCNSEGHSLLGDFGAASFLPKNDAQMSESLQRIEVRAFGILLGELLAHCVEPTDESIQTVKSNLDVLQQQCMQAEVSGRPLFAAVAQELEKCKLHIEVASSIS